MSSTISTDRLSVFVALVRTVRESQKRQDPYPGFEELLDAEVALLEADLRAAALEVVAEEGGVA